MQKKEQKCKKKAEMQKKSRKCTFDFKINAKKGHKCKKKAENTFSISKFIQKNIKKGKKKAHLFGFFSLLYPLCILNLKIHIKKDKNAKKSIKIFSNCKNKHAKKKA